MALKDDNLGLGAKRGSGHAETQCTGLDAFQGLLGRLNGKTDGELQKEQDSRDALKRAIYMEGRWGSVRFVSGGFLVGANLQIAEDSEAANLRVVSRLGGPQQPAALLPSQIHPKAQEQDATRHGGAESAPLAAGETVSRKKKSKRSRSHGRMNNVNSMEAVAQGKPQLGNSVCNLSDSTAALSSSTFDNGPTSGEHNDHKKEAKAEQSRAKSERRAIRHAKRKRKVAQEESLTTITCTDSSKPSVLVEDVAKASNIADHSQFDSSNMVTTTSSATMFAGGRHAVRRRYIQQKRLAVVNVQALNEVCARMN